MAQKDIEVRIRARDDASKSVKRVSEALKAIESDANKAAQGASKASGALGGIANDIAKLRSESDKLNSLGKIALELEKAGRAADKFETSAQRAAEELARTRSASDAAAATLGQLTTKYNAEKAALEGLKASRAQATEAIAKQKTEIAGLQKELAKLEGQQKRGVLDTSGLMRRDQIRNTLLPQSGANLAKLETELATYTKGIKDADAAMAALKPSLNDAEREFKALSSETDRAGNAMLAARVDAAAAKNELAQIGAAAQQASSALGGVGVTQADVANASAKLNDRLAQQQKLLESAGRYATGNGDFTDPKTAASLQKQNDVVRQAKDDWKTLEAEIKRYAQTISATSGNVTEQVDAQRRLIGAAQQAKAVFQQEASALEELRLKAGLSASGIAGASASATAAARIEAQAQAAASAEAQKAARAQTQLAPAKQRTTTAARDQKSALDALRGSLIGLNGDTRQTLGFMQRLRGEVLAVTTSYIGFQAAIGQIGQSVDAYRTLEAVQSRLGAVFQQNTAQVGQEVDFLRAQADRLGISFSVLSDNYGRFAVAANQANFSQQATRDIFLSVAEAARVNKLSLDQMNGTFLAIEQIISKGKFTSEEVRRQLGDRLPGAFNILANAMGKTTAELDKMMANGDLLATESNLMKFANEMQSRFGPQLGASLDTLSTDIGRFENDVFKAQLALAQGFVPALRDALQAFNKFANSEEGAQTFAMIGEAAGELIGILAEIPKYFDLITLAAQGFIAVKLAGSLVTIYDTVVRANGAFKAYLATMTMMGPPTQAVLQSQTAFDVAIGRSIGWIDSYRAALLRSTSTYAVVNAGTKGFAVALGALRSAMLVTMGVARALWMAIGGLPGIIATGITIALTSWITSTNSATSALAEHERQLQKVREEYQLAKGDAAKWSQTVNSVTIVEAQDDVKRLRDEYDSLADAVARYALLARAKVSVPGGDPNSPVFKQAEELVSLGEAFKSGALSLNDFRLKLDAIAQNQNFDADLREIAAEMIRMSNAQTEAGESLDDLGKAVEVAEAKLRLRLGQGTPEDVRKVLGDLGDTVDDVNQSFSDENVGIYTKAIEDLRNMVPSLTEEMKRLKDITELNKTAWDGLIAAFKSKDLKAISEIISLWTKGRGEMMISGIVDSLGSGVSATSNLIKRFEGFRSTAYWDTNAFRAGYGSDTVTLSDGSVQAITEGMTVTLADAERDLARRIAEFQNIVKGQIGESRFESFNDQQKAVLTSIAYNYGSLPQRILDEIATGDANLISQAISGLAGDNNGVNANRRNQEAAIFLNGGNADIAPLVEAEQDRLKKLQEQSEETQKQIADTNFQIEQQKLINSGKEREAAIEAAIRDARAANPGITDAEIAKIREQTGALYDLQNANAGLNLQEERTNQLYTLRQQLLEQLQMAQDQGDATMVASLRDRISEVNSQLESAIQKTIAMWQAVGGPEAEAAIAKLQTMNMSIKDAKVTYGSFGLTTKTWEGIIQNGIEGVISVFDTFAQAVANGENAFKAFGQAVLGVLAKVLQEIAVAIIRMQILKALSGLGGPIGAVATAMLPAAHTGGLVGSTFIGGGNAMRPAWADSAFAYHTGGIAGLAPDEVGAVLKKNEEVLTEEDPRHRFNLGGESKSSTSKPLKQVLAIGDDEIANALAGASGEKVVLTHLSRNKAKITRMLGG